MSSSTSSSPALVVTLVEVRGLKHDGTHSFELSLLGHGKQSPFTEGPGNFKSLNYSVSFKMSEEKTLSNSFWTSSMLYVTVLHQRMFTPDKVVGECSIPISVARSGPSSTWYALRYKGEQRGSIKVSLIPRHIAPPAASATVLPSDSSRVREIFQSRKLPESAPELGAVSPSPPIETRDLLGLGDPMTPSRRPRKKVSFSMESESRDRDSRQTSMSTPTSSIQGVFVASDWPQ